MKAFKYIIFSIILLGIVSCANSSQASKRVEVGEKKTEKYEANWASLEKHKAAPEWFTDSKLGIYFHWGVYSVPAFGSAWYPRNMLIEGKREKKYHEKEYGKIEQFGYEDFIPMFTARHFDPEEWADLFQESGAKFAGPVAQHHDGFAMWNSEVNPWNAAAMGPKQDVLGKLFTALKKRDMKTIATFHHSRHGQRNANVPKEWGKGFNSHYPYHPSLPSATKDSILRKLYGNFETLDEFYKYWLGQVNEVVDKYAPDIIWYDSWLNTIPENYRLEMAAHFFNSGLKNNKEVVTCHKQNDMPMSISVLDYEQGGRREIHPMPWMTDITIGETRWMYVKDHPYKKADLILKNMIDVWSKNGIVLLNVSPTADGVINQEQRAILKQIGDWLKIHGEAVYETRPFITFGYGNAKAADGHFGGQSATTKFTANDVRFTLSKDKKTLYAFFLGQPKSNERIQMRPLGSHRYPTPSPIKRITVLGTGTEVEWELNSETFYLTMPDEKMNELATVFKFELE